MNNVLAAGTRVVVADAHPDLNGMTGTVLDGPRETWATYGVLIDRQWDPEQLPAAFFRDELEVISE
jgi:hypothetical protein